MVELKQKAKTMERQVQSLQEQLSNEQKSPRGGNVDHQKIVNQFNEKIKLIEKNHQLANQEKEKRNTETINQLTNQHKKNMQVLRYELESLEEKCELLEKEKNEILEQEKEHYQQQQQKFKQETEKLLEEKNKMLEILKKQSEDHKNQLSNMQQFNYEMSSTEDYEEDRQKVRELKNVISKQNKTIELQNLSISSLEKQLNLKKEQNEKLVEEIKNYSENINKVDLIKEENENLLKENDKLLKNVSLLQKEISEFSKRKENNQNLQFNLQYEKQLQTLKNENESLLRNQKINTGEKEIQIQNLLQKNEFLVEENKMLFQRVEKLLSNLKKRYVEDNDTSLSFSEDPKVENKSILFLKNLESISLIFNKLEKDSLKWKRKVSLLNTALEESKNSMQG